jgi:serine protease Do
MSRNRFQRSDPMFNPLHILRFRRARVLIGSLCAAALLSAVLVGPGFSQSSADQFNLPSFNQLIKQYDDAVVSVRAERSASRQSMPEMELPEGMPEQFRKFFEEGPGNRFFFGPGPGPRQPMAGQGSGFIVSDDGYVLTNAHVIDGADRVTVRLSDRREYQAEVIGRDQQSDVALLKIEADELPSVRIGDSDAIEIGDWVLAIGSPFGFERSATQGIVSATGRSLPDGTYVPFIQTDAAVNPGNSGGPLFNLDGEVIGINSQIYSRTGGYQGLSFAIPINLAMDVVEQLKTRGHVSRGWLGVSIQDLNQPLAESFGLDRPAGALISEVIADSPAAAAGLQPGDVIVSYNGRELERSGDLPPLVGRTPIGENAMLTVLRDGEPREIEVAIGELERSGETVELASAEQEGARLGVAVAGLDAEQRRQLDLDQGVMVREVQPGSPAASAGIQQGDVILSFNNRPVEDAGKLAELVEAAPADKPSVVLIARERGRLFLPVQLG